MPQAAYIGVGSNLNDRKSLIEKAKTLLCLNDKIIFLRSAPFYETQPVGGPRQGLFLNTVWEIESELSAGELLDWLLKIETQLGRVRNEPLGPRTIDLDLLFFGDQIIQTPRLTVPHPRVQDRWFVLKPLWDLRADLVHPILQKSVCELLDEIDEKHKRSKKTK